MLPRGHLTREAKKERESSRQRKTMMIDQLARAHRNNIQRYRSLLQTNLTEFERQFVERRLNEEQSKLETLISSVSNEVHRDRSCGLGSRLA
jgi:hypothetical protein